LIEVTRDGALWTLRLNRPEKANSLTRDMLADLAAAAREAKGTARAVILTGTGKVFSAGADLDAARAGLATDPVWEDLSGAIADLPCLTIAALNGTLAGGAFGMVLACDLRIAVPVATFFYPVMKLGFLPQPSDPGRLAALVGPSRTKHLLMAGARIDAETALISGLVDEVVPPEELMDRARALASHSLDAEADHAVAIKRMCRT
jgi:enoyl-CoA hydratase/carnithine racemase